jgi:two-component system chemotaxis response regulator CheB
VSAANHAAGSRGSAPLPAGDGGSRRVLVVDDSAVARAVIARTLEASGRYLVAGSVANATAALEFLARVRVDAVLLDIQMPGVDGLTALPDLLAATDARVLIVSAAAGEGAVATVQALALGAADTLVKPSTGDSSARFGEQLLEKLDRLGQPASPVLPPPAPAPAPLRLSERLASAALAARDNFDVIAIGASTGGIHALSGMLRALPASVTQPILITQHLPASFMPYFAAQLTLIAGRPCEVAVDRLRMRPGRMIVAPGDAHLRCVRLADGGGAVRLSDELVTSGCLPSVDPMFASVASAFGSRVLAIVLSGMGRDGAEGARVVHAAGGCVVVQDQPSSTVWGMPGAVAALGLADAVLAPEAIGRLLAGGRRP